MAWLIEIVCVGIGLLVAVLAGLEAAGPGAHGLWTGGIAAAPFVGAAVIELGRIPLVRSFFVVRGRLYKLLAVVAILLAGALTMENLLFGFERAFIVRIEAVRLRSQVYDDAHAEAARAGTTAQQLEQRRTALRDELGTLLAQETDQLRVAGKDADRARESAQQMSGVLADQLRAAERDRAALARMQATGAQVPGALARADRRVADARAALTRRDTAEQTAQAGIAGQSQAALGTLRTRRAALQDEQGTIEQQTVAAEQALDAANRSADHALADLDVARRSSQMHRLARFFFHADDNASAMRMLTWFSMLAAGVLSTTGSILAALFFRSRTQPPAPAPTQRPDRLVRALRGLLVRLRRRHSIVRTVKVETVREVEVPVERVVEKIIEVVKPELVLVPVPLEATESERRRIMEQAARALPQGPRALSGT